MSTLKISEAGTVQFPMVKHAVEIGWTSITPEDARTKRGGEAGTFFRDVLEAKLAAFNSWMSVRMSTAQRCTSRASHLFPFQGKSKSTFFRRWLMLTALAFLRCRPRD